MTTEEDEEARGRRARLDTRAEPRSRSRGRTPSELLARKQQLLMAKEAAGAPSPKHRTNPSGGDTDQAGEQTGAGAKLESLSALLRNQQQEETAPASASSLKSIDDVYILLAKKEKDLQLAAELGKVLLERNDELSKANERIAEEYSHKLELLEQEKHKLKRKLDQLDGEYENRIIELQTDCNILKNKLDQQQATGRQAEKEKSKLIDDLVQQNQRLTSELAEATKSEELLAGQLEQVNERLNGRLSSRSDHVVQVDALQDEIQILNRRKLDLERRLKVAGNEKSNLLGTIEETGDKVLILENLLNERDLKIGELALEINELRDSSSWLSSKLESMIALNERLVGVTAGNQQETTSELEVISERERSHLIGQLKDLRLKRNSRMKANELILAGAAERQRRSLAVRSQQPDERGRGRGRRRRRQSLFGTSQPEVDEEDDGNGSYSSECESPAAAAAMQISSNDLICELFAIFSQLHAHLLRRRDQLQQAATSGGSATAISSGATDSGIGSSALMDEEVEVAVGKVADLEQWRQLVASLRQLIEEMPCSSCQLLIAERVDFEQLQKLHARQREELKVKSEELLDKSGKLIELEAKLETLEEQTRLLQLDLESCDKPTEEIVRLAWKARDEAVGRKNNAEITLAKTRIENMQVSSQLMEVVQQKGELSQKLAQFEDDIHYMMQRSVRARFSWEEYAEQTRRLGANQSAGQSPTSENQNSTIQQLLSLSSIVLMSPTKKMQQQQQESPAQLDSLGSNLLTNIKSSRFNLKFWQRSSSNSTSSSQQTPQIQTSS